MQKFAPYLMFNGNCEEPVNYFKECFNGEIGLMGRHVDSPMEVPRSRKDKIVHVELKFWGRSILASDNMYSTESSKTDSSCVHLSLGFDDPLKMERTHEKLNQDGQPTMPLKEQFCGEKSEINLKKT